MTNKTARALRGGVKMVCVGAAALWLASCAMLDPGSYDSGARPAPSMAGSYKEGGVFDEKGVDPWKWMPDEVGNRFAAKPF